MGLEKRKKIIFFILSALCVCAVWWALRPHIDAQLAVWVTKWIEPLDKLYAVIGFYVLVAIGIGIYNYEHIKRKAHPTTKGWWVVIVSSIIYSYYRFYPDAPFEFWSTSWYVWMDILYVIDAVLIASEVSYRIRLWHIEQETAQQNGDLLRDDAIAEIEDDILEYGLKAIELAAYLESVDLSRHAFSVGIAGEWGIGKSSLLNLFAKNQEEAGHIVIRFAPRNAKRVDLIQEEFFSVFTHELSKYTFNAHRIIGKYIYALNLHSSTRWVYSILDWFVNWTAASEKERINKLISSTGKNIYVLIEDLDRLTGPEILETLKLIDANGNFRNTVFMTAYDKKYVNSVLRKMIGYDDSLADFTDKYFHYELSMFKQQHQALYAFMMQHMCRWAIHLCEEDVHQQKVIQRAWLSVYGKLSTYITTIRQAKRYINLFRTTYRKCWEKVNFSDFAIVTLIRFLDMQTYYDIYEKKFITYGGKFSVDRTQYVLAEGYKEIAKKSKIENLSSLLEMLFRVTGGISQFESSYNRIYRAVSFDNYFYYVIRGRLYYGDINEMVNAKTVKDAILLFDKYVDIVEADSAEQSIEEFLISRDAEWIMTKARLTRYVCLLIYGVGKLSSRYIRSTLTDMLHVEGRASYEDIMTASEYNECILSAFEEMMDYSPYIVGQMMRERLKERYARAEEVSNLVIDTAEQDQQLLNKAQKSYDAMSQSAAWDAAKSLGLAEEISLEDEKQIAIRQKQLKKMLNTHPDRYGMILLAFGHPESVKKDTTVSFRNQQLVEQTLGGAIAFEKWTRKIKDGNLRSIIMALYNHIRTGYGPFILLGQYIEKPAENLKRVAQIITKKK